MSRTSFQLVWCGGSFTKRIFLCASASKSPLSSWSGRTEDPLTHSHLLLNLEYSSPAGLVSRAIHETHFLLFRDLKHYQNDTTSRTATMKCGWLDAYL
jgi:hypothetical protein